MHLQCETIEWDIDQHDQWHRGQEAKDSHRDGIHRLGVKQVDPRQCWGQSDQNSIEEWHLFRWIFCKQLET